MLGTRLRALRQAAGLTQDRVAELVCAATGRATLTRNEISRYERGVRVPSVPTLRVLAEVLGTDLRHLEALRAGAAAVLDDEQVDRLSYVTAHPRSVDTPTVEALSAMLAANRVLEDEIGAAPVREPVRAALGLAEQLASDARAPVRPALVGLVSELCQYLGWLHIPTRRATDVFTAADQRAAALLDRAAVLGMEADDPHRVGMALSFKAYLHLGIGDLRATAALNQAARRDRRVHTAQRTYFTFQTAEVLARDGDRHAARTELAAAEALMQQVPADLPSWGYWYTPAFFAGSRALVLHALGERAEARQAMAESIAAMPVTWQRAEWADRRRALVD